MVYKYVYKLFLTYFSPTCLQLYKWLIYKYDKLFIIYLDALKNFLKVCLSKNIKFYTIEKEKWM